MGMYDRPEHTWDAEEREGIEQVVFKIKRVMRKLYTHRPMLFDEHPDLGYAGPDGGEVGCDSDGMCMVGRFTPDGLTYAKMRVRGTALERGPVSCLANLPAEKRSLAPAWAQDEYARETRA
jgi:hypothetical protein